MAVDMLSQMAAQMMKFKRALLSDIVPHSMVEPSVAHQFFKDAVERVLERASIKFNRPPEALQIRSGLPNSDFGLTNEVWTTAGAPTVNAYNVLINNNRMSNSKVACFYGVVVEDPWQQVAIVSFEENAGTSTRVRVDVEKLYSYQEPIGYLQKPVIYDPDQLVHVRFYARASVGAVRLIPLVIIAEPRDYKEF